MNDNNPYKLKNINSKTEHFSHLILGKFNSLFITVEEGIQPDIVPTQDGRHIFPTLKRDKRKNKHRALRIKKVTEKY